ncbi:MAG: YggS family pyridoxal phosphate-dependent enzyme [Anaerolineae bacterium]|nr:MAG: YggS family pyridoxal phosphate-dependent enzyme [Anaerolineae bacterium]
MSKHNLNSLVETIRSRYLSIRAQIEAAAQRVGRDPQAVRLVVVSKTHPVETVQAAIEAGIRDFGENYAEEALQKIQAFHAIEGLRWHMIGHVQSRKADLVAGHFDWMHSLDSLKLANRLERFAAQNGRTLPVLLECNVGGETSKFGYAASTPQDLEILSREVEQIALLPHLQIRGLMTMPPLYNDPEQTRPFFAKLRQVRDFLAEKFPMLDWRELSMGTSADFVAAVEEGATFVRIGTAILGARPPKSYS